MIRPRLALRLSLIAFLIALVGSPLRPAARIIDPASPPSGSSAAPAEQPACATTIHSVYLPGLNGPGPGPAEEIEPVYEPMIPAETQPVQVASNPQFSGISPTGFNPLRPAARLSVECTRVSTDPSRTAITVNGDLLGSGDIVYGAQSLDFQPELRDGPNYIAISAYDALMRLTEAHATVWAGGGRLDVTVRDQAGDELSGITVTATLAEDERVQAVATAVNGIATFTNLPNRTIFLSAEHAGQIGIQSASGGDVYATLQLSASNNAPPSPVANNDFSQGVAGWEIGDANVELIEHSESTPPTAPRPADLAAAQSSRGAAPAQAAAVFRPAAPEPAQASAANDLDLVLKTAGDVPQTIERTFATQAGMTGVTLRFRFATGEIPGGYFGTRYDDSYQVTLRSRSMGRVSMIQNSMNGLGLSAFDEGGSTRWFDIAVPVSMAGDQVEVKISVGNVGDSQLNSMIVLDKLTETNTDLITLGSRPKTITQNGNPLNVYEIGPSTILGLEGDPATFTYEWQRSAGLSDANYQPLVQNGATLLTGPSDLGHRYKVTVSNGSKSVTSEPIAIGPLLKPRVAYPVMGEEIRVNRPYLSIVNANHEPHDQASAPAYSYEFQVAVDASFKSLLHQAVITAPENKTNKDVTYVQVPVALPATTADKPYHWRARAVVAGAPGLWSAAGSFHIANVWSPDGNTWHTPMDYSDAGGNSLLRASGSFMESRHGGVGDTYLHTGMDISQWVTGTPTACKQPVRAARSGILMRADDPNFTDKLNVVGLLHTDVQSQTHYIHMESVTRTHNLARGVFINQGTALGVMGTATNYDCHLHFNLANQNSGVYYNPLREFPWQDTQIPVIEEAYVRSNNLLDSLTSGISQTVFLIAKTHDPAIANKIAPYKMSFTIDGQEQCQTIENRRQCTIVFDQFTSTDREWNYYAYLNKNTKTDNRKDNPKYILYYAWNPAGRADNAGPARISVVASDYYNHNSTPYQLTLGPNLSQSAAVPVSIRRCAPQPQTVQFTIANANTGITGVTSDTYTLALDKGAVAAELSAAKVTVNNGQASAPITLTVSGTTGGTVRVIASSGIVTTIKDAFDVNVQIAECR